MSNKSAGLVLVSCCVCKYRIFFLIIPSVLCVRGIWHLEGAYLSKSQFNLTLPEKPHNAVHLKAFDIKVFHNVNTVSTGFEIGKCRGQDFRHVVYHPLT